MKTLIIIPARGGSKGIPNKNIKLLNGKPLIQYTIEAAKKINKDIDICMTSDSDLIIDTVKNIGLAVPFKRPSHLANDNSGTYEVLLHAINYYKNKGVIYDTITLLQPTSPLRNERHIQEALAVYSDNLDMVVSVKETESNPYYVLFEEDKNGYLQKSKDGDFNRRQDCPKVWEYNGAIYIINVKSLQNKPLSKFKKIKKYIMDNKHSIDIDTEYDFNFAQFLLSE
jgi:N-acylneuraminate cytidylyltransferase